MFLYSLNRRYIILFCTCIPKMHDAFVDIYTLVDPLLCEMVVIEFPASAFWHKNDGQEKSEGVTLKA